MATTTFITPKELHTQIPLLPADEQFITQARANVQAVLNAQDERLLLIVGPCSIHDLKGAKEYAERLKKLALSVASSFLIVMRAYFEKPRTALGWKGFIHDPFLDGSHAINSGYELSRELLLFLARLELPAACEFLDPLSAIYNGDLITWGCIGARTSASQVHRQLASHLVLPIAFKNSTDGNIETAVNGCLAASHAHSFLALNREGVLSIHHSKGNPHTHVVLRGGEGKPNYHPSSIDATIRLMERAGLPPRILVDCSHDNCEKKSELQLTVFESVLQQTVQEKSIRGLMLESYLNAGNQPLKGIPRDLRFGVSITDPCLSWEETEQLIQTAHQKLQKKSTSLT